MRRKYDPEVIDAARILAPIFAANDWQWASCNGVPTEADIRDAIQGTVDRLAGDHNVWAINSGRIEVRRIDGPYGPEEITISLSLGYIDIDNGGVA